MMIPSARVALGPLFTGEITDVWIDESLLYVAAGAEGVKVYLVEPACPGP